MWQSVTDTSSVVCHTCREAGMRECTHTIIKLKLYTGKLQLQSCYGLHILHLAMYKLFQGFSQLAGIHDFLFQLLANRNKGVTIPECCPEGDYSTVVETLAFDGN